MPSPVPFMTSVLGMVLACLVAGVIHRPAVVVMPDMLLGLLFSGGLLYST